MFKLLKNSDLNFFFVNSGVDFSDLFLVGFLTSSFFILVSIYFSIVLVILSVWMSF